MTNKSHLISGTALLLALVLPACSDSSEDGSASSAAQQLTTAEGWESSISTLPFQGDTNAKALIFQLYDRKDDPIEGAKVTVIITSETNADYKEMTKMEEAAPGYYALQMAFDDAGPWTFRIAAVKGNKIHQNQKTLEF